MSACFTCQNLGFHIEIKVGEDRNTHAKYVDECSFYPHMAGKVEFKYDCPQYVKRWHDDDNKESDDIEENEGNGEDA